jgi:predicted solute-binding protein
MVRNPDVAARDVDDRIGGATRRGLAAVSTIARSYDADIDPMRAEHYLRQVIRYDLGEREKEGLALFHRLARRSGLLAPAKELEFHAI